MVINKKILRTFKSNKIKYLLTLLLISLSTCMFISFNANGKCIKSSLNSFIEDCNQEDANFRIGESDFDIEDIESKFNVDIEKRYYYDYSNGDKTIRLLSDTDKIDKYSLIEGKEISKDGIIIDESYAKSNGIKVNDFLEIEGKKYNVVGIATYPDYIYKVKSESTPILETKNFLVAVVSKENFEDFSSKIEYYILKNNGTSSLYDIRSYISKNYTLTYWLNKTDNPRINKITGDYDVIMLVGRIIPFVIVLVSSILIVFLILNQIKKEYVQIGTLYALGYRKKEITKHYLQYPFILSIIGAIIGIILGIGLGPYIIEPIFSAQYILPKISYNFDFTVVIIAALIPIITLNTITYISLKDILNTAPIKLMRGNLKYKVSKLEARIKINRLNFKIKFKIKEIIRNKARVLLILAGVVFVSWLMLFGLLMRESINQVLNDNFSSVYKYQYIYNLKTFKTDDNIDGEKNLVVSGFLSSNDKDTFSLYGVDRSNDLLNLFDQEGNKISKDNIVISKHLANKLNLKKGDTITFKNSVNLEETSIKIDDISEVYIGDTIYMPRKELSEIIGFDSNCYNQIMSLNEINTLSDDELLSNENIDKIKNSYVELMKPINMFIYMLILMSVIIGIIIIYIITLLIIEDNTRNISLMKILGYRNTELNKLVININTIFVVLGLVISLPIIKLSNKFLFNKLTESLSIYLPNDISISSVIICFTVTVFTYLISKYINSKNILKIKLSYILKERNE